MAPLLHSLDEVVHDAGGRLYLAKDGHTTADVLPSWLPAARRVEGDPRRGRPRAACGSATRPAAWRCTDAAADTERTCNDRGERTRGAPDDRAARRHQRHRPGDRHRTDRTEHSHRRPRRSPSRRSTTRGARTARCDRRVDRLRRRRHRVARGVRAVARPTRSATSTSSSSPSACSATSRRSRATRPRPPQRCTSTTPARSACRWPSRRNSAGRGTAVSSCCRASPANGCARRTSCTGRRRPGSTGSPRVSPTRSQGSGASVLVVRPGFVHSRMTAGPRPGAVRHHAPPGRRRHRRRAAAWTSHGLVAGGPAVHVRHPPTPTTGVVPSTSAGLMPTPLPGPQRWYSVTSAGLSIPS